MRKARVIWSIIAALMLAGSGFFYYYSHSDERLIRISTNPWVGFTPFIYAQEKGWLEKTPFRFMWLVDLTDNARLYERGFTQGFTATQYELLHFKKQGHIKPVFLIDRSAGADVILSNATIEELRIAREPVTVYLEMGSLGEDFFNAFVHENGLENIHFTLTNSSQATMSKIDTKGSPVILVSYSPYTTELTKKGFDTIGSTKTMRSFFVIDALYMDERFIDGREKQYQELKTIFNLALERFYADPQEYYETIRGYLEGQSYEEFMASTTQIEWLSENVNSTIPHHLQMQHIATDRLLP
jgi:NitT/TauT family transport system substrate-binding protein